MDKFIPREDSSRDLVIARFRDNEVNMNKRYAKREDELHNKIMNTNLGVERNALIAEYQKLKPAYDEWVNKNYEACKVELKAYDEQNVS